MERGTREKSLLQDHCGSTEGFVKILRTLGTADVRSASATVPFFTWRSGDDVAAGGHITVPSIGQNIPFSTSNAAPSVTEKSGNAHIVPVT